MKNVLLVLGVVSIFSLFLIDICGGSDSEMYAAKVLDRQYVPSRTWTTTTFDSDGWPHIHTHHDPEKWIIVISVNDTLQTMQTDKQHWEMADKGTRVPVKQRFGRWTKWSYGWAIQ